MSFISFVGIVYVVVGLLIFLWASRKLPELNKLGHAAFALIWLPAFVVGLAVDLVCDFISFQDTKD